MEPIDYSRGRNNENSKVAFNIVKQTLSATKLEILSHVDGILCTLEIAVRMGRHHHKISGRFSELEASGKIIKIGIKKIGRSPFGIYRKLN
ncbi:hypothetical protein [Chryseobacterium daeguense]|uniref:hypothetical protein n=1 Tax=Chryseobacterium daeguense TaxID=412438 RepID=UPI0004883E43|nr:hypothetical protein [Chryseobacterium daeguense]